MTTMLLSVASLFFSAVAIIVAIWAAKRCTHPSTLIEETNYCPEHRGAVCIKIFCDLCQKDIRHSVKSR